MRIDASPGVDRNPRRGSSSLIVSWFLPSNHQNTVRNDTCNMLTVLRYADCVALAAAIA
ncbi:hypothetical protein CLDAP_37460 [Caldilinea aerophila DSM 14535 = NBRC 104270]|uniref:Uncharacterized protein n=1 Tax=Caldilinea aerophila (strain DSM 14535 / JCM 11387 / NBRC 104270 / STL-6-O1) TaxID=926550 RepID=I0I948_CALAS|nr:hypothetical protein CLDAP_37460 [Caldilinea aerophila DSM 14535 = NBRC 104270]